jgi:predicted nucleic acid-binding protein
VRTLGSESGAPRLPSPDLSAEKAALLEAIASKAEILPPLGEVPAFTRDPKDDKFVACALAGHADYVISLDKDVLSLGMVGEVRMVAPHQFVSKANS